MGFWAGFGSSFSNSYENALERSSKKEDDAFKLSFDALMKRKDAWDTYQAEDSKAVKSAEQYVKDYNLPPEAMGTIYNWIKSNRSPEYIENAAANGKWSVNKATGQVSQAPDVEKMEQSAEDQQMEQSGLAPAQPSQPVAQPQAQQTSFDGEGFLSQVFPKMRRANREQRVQNRVNEAARASGMSDQELNRISQPYQAPQFDNSGVSFEMPTPEPEANNLPEAQKELRLAEAAVAANPDDPKAKSRLQMAQVTQKAIQEAEIIKGNIESMAQGNTPIQGRADLLLVPDPKTGTSSYTSGTWDGTQWVDGKGKPILGASAMSKEDRQWIQDIGKTLDKPAQDVFLKQNSWMSAANAAAQMDAAVQATGGAVLQDLTSGVAQWGQNLTAEAAAALEVLNNTKSETVGKIDEAQLQKSVDTLQKINDNYQGSEAGKLAHQRALFEAQRAMLAYHLAATVGQSNKSLSETERTMFENMASGGVTPQQFHEIMSGLLYNQAKSIDAEAKAIASNPSANAYKAAHQGAIPDLYSPKTIEELAQADPALKPFLARLEPYRKVNENQEVKSNEGEAVDKSPDNLKKTDVQGQKKAIAKTADGRIVYQMPDGSTVDEAGNPVKIKQKKE